MLRLLNCPFIPQATPTYLNLFLRIFNSDRGEAVLGGGVGGGVIMAKLKSMTDYFKST